LTVEGIATFTQHMVKRAAFRDGKAMSGSKPRRQFRSEWRHFLEIQTRWSDNDVYGHVNNTVYYSWFDTAVNNWLIRQGLLDLEHSPVVSLVVETGCSYFESVAYPESVDVGLRVERIGTSSVTYGLGVFRKRTELAAAVGRFVHVAVDRETRRAVPLPDALRIALRELAV
jgi:acyl-CoA thioester hydrolase